MIAACDGSVAWIQEKFSVSAIGMVCVRSAPKGTKSREWGVGATWGGQVMG